MSRPRSAVLYLDPILERIQRIDDCAQEGRGAFDASHMLQDTVMRTFQDRGAAKRLSPALLEQSPAVPWRRVAGFREVLIHHYMGVDPDEVWNVIAKDLTPLKQTVQTMRADLAEDA